MGKSLLMVVAVLLFAYLCLGLFLYLFQRGFIYLPRPEVSGFQASNFRLESGGEVLKIWVLNKDNDNAIIYFGGNAEAVEYNIGEFEQVFAGRTVYLMNYRGYGGSTGEPTELGLYADALALYDSVKSRHGGIFVMGRSLGSGVATYLATEREVKKLALITPFDTIESIARTSFPIFPVSLLLKDKFDSISRAKNIASQTMILMAEFDQVVPGKLTKRLAEEFNATQTTVKVLPDTHHNSISAHPNYHQLLSEFFK